MADVYARPSCPDCGSEAFSQLDQDPLICTRCGCEWLVDGWHIPVDELVETVLKITVDVDISDARPVTPEPITQREAFASTISSIFGIPMQMLEGPNDHLHTPITERHDS